MTCCLIYDTSRGKSEKGLSAALLIYTSTFFAFNPRHDLQSVKSFLIHIYEFDNKLGFFSSHN